MKNSPGGRIFLLFCRIGSSYGADAGAGTAFDALLGVYNVFAVTLGNSRNGALSLARTAAQTFVIDNVCHNNTSISFILIQYNTKNPFCQMFL